MNAELDLRQNEFLFTLLWCCQRAELVESYEHGGVKRSDESWAIEPGTQERVAVIGESVPEILLCLATWKMCEYGDRAFANILMVLEGLGMVESVNQPFRVTGTSTFRTCGDIWHVVQEQHETVARDATGNECLRYPVEMPWWSFTQAGWQTVHRCKQEQSGGFEDGRTIDFRSVRWDGALYEFTSLQAQCVRLYWEAFKNGTPGLAEGTVLEEVKAGDRQRLRDVFRDHPAWGTMIVQAGR